MKKVCCLLTVLILFLPLSSRKAEALDSVGDVNKEIRSLERQRDQLSRQLKQGNAKMISLMATANQLKAENNALADRVKELLSAFTEFQSSWGKDSMAFERRMTLSDVTAENLELKIQKFAEKETELENWVERLKNQTIHLETWLTGYQGFIDHVTIEQNEINGLKGPHIFFTGVNVHIRSGLGATDDAGSGTGNLIVGYNENFTGNPRTGSHNLIVGPGHDYRSCGGFVAGFSNTISGRYASVSGGAENTASGNVSSVSGGRMLESGGNYSWMPW